MGDFVEFNLIREVSCYNKNRMGKRKTSKRLRQQSNQGFPAGVAVQHHRLLVL